MTTLYHQHQRNYRALTVPELASCELDRAGWLPLFESTPQPMKRIVSGKSTVYELANTYLCVPGQPQMQLNDWSPFNQYFNQEASELTIVNTLNELNGCFLYEKNEIPTIHQRFLIKKISFFLRRYPNLHSFASAQLKRYRYCRQWFIQRRILI